MQQLELRLEIITETLYHIVEIVYVLIILLQLFLQGINQSNWLKSKWVKPFVAPGNPIRGIIIGQYQQRMLDQILEGGKREKPNMNTIYHHYYYYYYYFRLHRVIHSSNTIHQLSNATSFTFTKRVLHSVALSNYIRFPLLKFCSS